MKRKRSYKRKGSRSTKRRKTGHGVLKSTPRSHRLIDVAHDLTQARMIIKSYPKQYRPKIIHTPKYKVYPYHIATLKDRR